MIRLGITGGIGSGKSYVCQMLTSQFDIPVYNCDQEAKRLTVSSAKIRKSLQQLVGKEVYDEEGTLNKAMLASYLFASPEHAAQVNALIHPAVKRDCRKWAKAQKSSIVAVESAILYESGFDNEVDSVLFVDAPLELRIQRAILRDGCSEEQINARIARQNSSLAKEKADFIIVNDGRPILEDLINIISKLC